MQMDVRQAEAVQSVGTNILVSASAGAGKTRVLVERLIKRVMVDRISIDRILAMTFTKAAAQEMKNRVAARLYGLYNDSTDEEEKSYIEEQLVLLSSADITTIDSFCLTIIKKYYPMIGMDPAMATNILDEGQQDLFKNIAFDRAMEDFYQTRNEDLLQILELYCVRSEDYDTLKDSVFKIITTAGHFFDMEGWFKEAAASYAPIKSSSEMDQNVILAFNYQIQLKLNILEECLQKMKDLSMTSEKVMDNLEQFTIIENAFANLVQRFHDSSYDMFQSSFINFCDLVSTPSDGKAEEYTKARDKFYDAITDLGNLLYDDETYTKDQNDLSNVAVTLVELAKLTNDYFMELKKEHIAMDFNDMEHFAYDILKVNDFAVSKLLKQQYDEVMVDEFQDTSLLQNTIIELIAKDGTIFRVGDVKQSIYRFRGAKPSLMRDLMHDENNKLIVLEHNYRSKENIVTYCNLLFDQLMNVKGCKDVYTDDDYVSTGAAYQILEEPVPCHFVLIHKDETNQKPTDNKTLKANWIAWKIQQLVETTKYTYKDIAILVKSHSEKPVIKKAFDYVGIPYNIETREGFFKSVLANTIQAFLKCMLNPYDNVNLLAVLTSPMYCLQENDLALLKIRYASFHEGVQSEYPEVFEDLKEFTKTASTKGLIAMLQQISNHNDFYVRLNKKEKANFDYLFEKVIQLEDKLSSILDLSNLMENSKEENSSEASSIGKDEDIVTVTTIHQSKGLQYPIVFLWSNSRNANLDAKNAIMVDDDFYIGLKHVDLPYRTVRKTPRRIAIEYKDNLEGLEEFTRVLYVALTRPMDRLYMVDTAPKDDIHQSDITIPLLDAKKGMTNLILSAKINDPDYFEVNHVDEVKLKRGSSIATEYSESLPEFIDQQELLPPLITPSNASLTLEPLDPINQSKGSAYGSLLHGTIEFLPNSLWNYDIFNQYDVPILFQDKLLTFSNSDFYKEALRGEIHKEYPFYIEKDSMRINGVIDFLSIFDDHILLLDFKTDRKSNDELKDLYKAQLQQYKKALKILYPSHSVQSFIYSFHNEEFVSMD